MKQFEEIYALRQQKSLKVEEAASLLGLSEQTFRRWVNRYEEEGLRGLYDHRLDKAACNAVPVDEALAMIELYREHYAGFSIENKSVGYGDVNPAEVAPAANPLSS